VMSVHKRLDTVREAALGSARIGTTGRGIGPCYADKASRCGIRVADLVDRDLFRTRLKSLLDVHNPVLEKVHGAEPFDLDDVYEEYCGHADKLRPYVQDALPVIHAALARGDDILLEGAQGSLLDVNFGTYPFVTSSEIVGGAAPGSGIPGKRITRIIGLTKAYSTRVGEGPFPTEQDNATGELLRKAGNEYGATTGRPRRCGWLDGAALRHSVALNGVDVISLGLLDVLSEFDTLKICVAYRLDGRSLDGLPASADVLARIEPVYRELSGWRCEISAVRSWEDLPEQAREYVRAVESVGGAPVGMVSVGPDRAQTILRDGDE